MDRRAHCESNRRHYLRRLNSAVVVKSNKEGDKTRSFCTGFALLRRHINATVNKLTEIAKYNDGVEVEIDGMVSFVLRYFLLFVFVVVSLRGGSMNRASEFFLECLLKENWGEHEILRISS